MESAFSGAEQNREKEKEKSLKGFLVMMAIAAVVSMSHPAEAKETKEGSFDRPVKTSVFQVGIDSHSEQEMANSKFIHPMHGNKKYQRAMNKILETKVDFDNFMNKNNLKIKEHGLFVGPNDNRIAGSTIWEAGITGKGFQAGLEKVSNNKKNELEIKAGEENSISFKTERRF